MTRQNRESIERSKPGNEIPEETPDVGLARIVRALRISRHGLASAWRTEGAFRQEVLVAIVAIPLAWLAPVPLAERVLLIASVLLVLIVELLNSSVEAAIDRISLERHPLSKKAKDTGSAAVLLAIACALFVWGAILGPRLFRYLANL